MTLLAVSPTSRPPYWSIQVWCETNLRRCISKFHRFVCDGCDKAFPLRSALDLHKATAHPEKPGSAHSEEPGVGQNAEPDQAKADLPAGQASFLQGLGLQHVSTVTMGSKVVFSFLFHHPLSPPAPHPFSPLSNSASKLLKFETATRRHYMLTSGRMTFTHTRTRAHNNPPPLCQIHEK